MNTVPHPLSAALAHFQRGDFDGAGALCRGCLAGDPENASAWHLLGLIEHRRGRLEEALVALSRGEQLGANAPSQRANHAGVLNAAGRHSDALALSQAALVTQPELAPGLINAGLAAAALGRHEDALRWLLAGLRKRPDALAARRPAVECAIALRRWSDVRNLMTHPSILADVNSALRLLRGWTMDGEGVRLEVLGDLARQYPDHPEVRYDHAIALHSAGQGGEAMPDAEAVLARAPQNSDAAMMLSVSLFEHGRVADGLAVLRDLLARHPDHDAAWASYLVGLHYDPTFDQAALLGEHRRWAECRLGDIVEQPVALLVLDPAPERALRIGWLSPRFVKGAVMQFFAGVIPAFDRSFATHVVYHDRHGTDSTTERLREQADEWRDVGGIDDAALVERMRSDRLDVVVDLAGHAPHNRMRALAQRVAPIQATWMDYVDTTCVPAMDLLFFDDAMAPPDRDEVVDERLVRLGPSRMAFVPPADSPEPDWADAADAPFTLACFNRMPKRHAGVFDRYAAVLSALPGSRLVLLDAALEGSSVRSHVQRWLSERGVDLSRVELLGRRSHHDLLEAYRRIDAVIDPFPYSGCTTTCDALWMGAPVLSCPGDTFASRQSASFLAALGRREWLCADEASLIAAARALAANPGRRSDLRLDLRRRMRSTVCDSRAVVESLQAVLRDAWRARCRRLA